MKLEAIDKKFIIDFISYLIEKGSQAVTQKNNFTLAKSILKRVLKRNLLNEDIFPTNPFPHINRRKKGQKALHKSEHKKLALALKHELNRFQSEIGFLSSYDLSICALAIALRTGLNPTPILELTTDCIKQHPLKNNRQLLVSFKRRGRNTHIQTVPNNNNLEILKSILMDTCSIIEMIKLRNASIREQSVLSNCLFVYPTQPGKGNISTLSGNTLHKSIQLFVDKHQLTNADGKRLVLNVMRLRKSFENRIWELSGQDPFVTASLAGHSIKVSNDYYLEAPAEAEQNWRMMGEIRNKEILDGNKENTPLAGCTDTRYGHLAPKNGSHCVNFLGCFRCPSFVVTEDDLFRLFSFYWLLIKERNLIGARNWERYYAHIIRIIDNQISPHFDKEIISQMKENAKSKPHPFWQTNDQLIKETVL